MGFYPPDASIPTEKRTARLFLRPLLASDATLDYDAVMSGAAMLRNWSGSIWPPDDFTIAENRADLERHEREHVARVAFTYTVLNPAGDRCLGCVYIQPVTADSAEACSDAGFATNVGFWVRASEIPNDLDRHLLTTLRGWLQTDWAFDCVLFSVLAQETRQTALLQDAGLELQRTISTGDGHTKLIFS